MVRKLVLSLIAVLGGGMLLAMAQSRQLSGTVVDQAGSPVVGATVMVEGSTVGTTTGAGGRFTLAVPADGTLQVSFIGYQTQSVPVNGRTSVEIRLSEDTKAIDEVLVVAYGTAKKESFTGSAAVIKSENLEKRVVSNVSKALDGQVAGVQTTSGSGQPGSEATVAIRGFGSISASSSPLYVVDGIAYSGSISAINPDDIESITVLKDASAGALYGARGANGVIVINTKRGREGNVEVNFKATLGVSRLRSGQSARIRRAELAVALQYGLFHLGLYRRCGPRLRVVASEWYAGRQLQPLQELQLGQSGGSRDGQGTRRCEIGLGRELDRQCDRGRRFPAGVPGLGVGRQQRSPRQHVVELPR